MDELAIEPALKGLCAGFELGVWRSKDFARYLLRWLPEFALSWSERQKFRDTTAVELVERAAAAVYASDKYQRRGEFGELMLHAIVRQIYNSEPVISKIFYKDSANDTVKGFDCVHVVHADGTNELELWLGEVKFYNDITGALSDVAKELAEHLESDYLRGEFALLRNKLDPSWPSSSRVEQLLHPNTSLDDVFSVLRIPVLLTYDSEVVKAHTSHSSEYVEAFGAEVRSIWERFEKKQLPANTYIHLLLVPLRSKQELLDHLHDGLRAWQNP